MKMDIVAGSKNDEFYTPSYAIVPLLKYLNFKNIWCPFDTEESNIVKELKKDNKNVIYTHISNGENFFDLNIDCDAIISNPPYSLKYEVLNRLFEIGKPFGMLLGVVGLFESQKRFEMFKNNKFEIMWLSKRVSYFKSFEEQKPSLNPPFSSIWLTSRILPSDNVFEYITK